MLDEQWGIQIEAQFVFQLTLINDERVQLFHNCANYTTHFTFHQD
jgi:hypothetical protein